jgi:hypothetical protein
MQPCRNNEWVRVFEVLDLSNRSMPRLSPAAPSIVSSTIANARHHVATATTLDGLCDVGHVSYMFYRSRRL